MDFKSELNKVRTAINEELEHQFDVAIGEIKKEDILMAEAIEYAKKVTLAGGKRMRGALMYWAYLGAGGKNQKEALKIAAAIELVHFFFLVHDDVMDRGKTRHGEKTLNVFFAGKKFAKYDNEHFGNSMAIIAGDMLYTMANKIITETNFSEKIKISALSEIQSIIATTIIGQSQDIAIAYNNKANQKQVLAMYRNKTARYSFEGPLFVGVKLAGCSDKKTLKKLSDFAIPLGIAFQIQDDILGIFGNNKKTGKSVASDIEEGKQSLLVVKAGELATSLQRKKIGSILGKKNLTQKEIKIFQDILKSTGSLAYSENMAKKYFAEGKKGIKKINLTKNAKKFFEGLVEYLENREV